MASRSMTIILLNFTNGELTLKDFGLSHGIWENHSSAVPPTTVGIAHPVAFGSESNGFATGTQGYAVYTSNQGEIRIEWNNPFAGSNGFGVAVPPGVRPIHTDISGNNANVELVLVNG